MTSEPESLEARIARLLKESLVMYDKGLITREELDGKLFGIAYLTIDSTTPIF